MKGKEEALCCLHWLLSKLRLGYLFSPMSAVGLQTCSRDGALAPTGSPQGCFASISSRTLLSPYKLFIAHGFASSDASCRRRADDLRIAPIEGPDCNRIRD